MNSKTAFETYLEQQNEETWSAALATLLRAIHEVDRNATQIWFAFYPLSLFRALEGGGRSPQSSRRNCSCRVITI
jgi:hypothetical protein